MGSNTDATQSEKYATHIENKLRAESGGNLRTHYMTTKINVVQDGIAISSKYVPYERSRITSAGKSVFYKITQTTIYISINEYQDGMKGIGTVITKTEQYDYGNPKESSTRYENIELMDIEN